MDIKPLSRITDKWSSNASSGEARTSYVEGVEAPRRSWSQEAAAADDRRKEGLAAADARDAFRTGVAKAGDAKWKDRARTLGPARFAQGVSAAKPAFSQGFAKYHSVISSTTLPPRGPKGDPSNLDRVRAVTEALHSAKVSG